jgi:heme exporter protein D
LPDLGKYADAVLASYAVSIALIVGLVVVSLAKSKKTQKQLAQIEARTTTKSL